MNEFLDLLARLAERVQAMQLFRSLGVAIIIYGFFVAVVYLLERRAGVDMARYRTRNFANDIAWTLFYRGGLYAVLILAAVTNLLASQLGFLQLHLLRGIPWPVGLALFWIGGDFITYWWHRLQHSNRFLWAFHSVHHSQEHLTLLSASRRHPLENLSMDILLYFVVFHLLLGVPTRGWAPLAALVTGLAAIQHAQLDWRLGPFARVFVSPRFHAVHHSSDPRLANANFGFLLSCWDHAFGTAAAGEPRPARYGVDGLDMKETLWDQLAIPFRLLRRGTRERAGSPTPHAPPAPQPTTLD